MHQLKIRSLSVVVVHSVFVEGVRMFSTLFSCVVQDLCVLHRFAERFVPAGSFTTWCIV